MMPLPFWPLMLALQQNYRQTNPACLMQRWIWGKMQEAASLLSSVQLLYWPSRTAAVGSMGAGAFCSVETTQLGSNCKEKQPSSPWRVGTFLLAGERLSWHTTQQGWLPPCWGMHEPAPSPSCHSKPALGAGYGQKKPAGQ